MAGEEKTLCNLSYQIISSPEHACDFSWHVKNTSVMLVKHKS